MNRTLLAVSIGLVLGAVLFGMVQRDQSVDASPGIHNPDASESAVRMAPWTRGAPEFVVEHPGAPARRPTWTAPTRSTTRDTPEASVITPIEPVRSDANREQMAVAQQWQQRRADRQRELAERRRQLLEQQGSNSSVVINDSFTARPTELAMDASSHRRAIEDRIADALRLESGEVASAREAFQDQLADGVGGESGARGTEGWNGDSASAPAGEINTIAELVDAIAGAMNGPTGSLAQGGFDFTKLTEFGGFLNGKLVTFGSGGGTVLTNPGLPPIPGFPPIPGVPGEPSDEEPLSVRAEWIPVAAGSCDLPEYSRANDLYIRVNKPFRVINVTSTLSAGLRVVGGEFLQNPAGDNVTPFDLTSCGALDTFLSFGPVVPTIAGSSPFPTTADGQAVSASWFGFSSPSVPGVVPPVTKPGDRRRLWLGRFVVTGNPTSVTGMLSVALVDPAAFIPIPQFVQVPIPDCLECWFVDGDPPPPALNRFDILSTNIVAGRPILIEIGLADPAPAGGVRINLSSSDSSVIAIPSAITVAEGQSSRTLSVRVGDVSVRTDILLTAAARGVVLSDSIAVDPRVASDIDSNGAVDGADLAALLAAWGTDHPFADANNDGVVDGADLAALLASWTNSAALPPDEGPVVARWIPVALSGPCVDALDGVRAADLYLGFDEPLLAPRATIVQSAAVSGLRVDGGVFYQDPDLNRNQAPDPFVISQIPCVIYDSYLTLGETAPFFTPGSTPDPDWGTELVAEWLTSDFSGSTITFETNFAKFGDTRRYLRIARISATEGADFVGGRLLVRYTPQSAAGGVVSEIVRVEHCATCWGQMDLNADGLLTGADVELLVAAMGTDSADADLNASGSVDSADLRMILEAMADPSFVP